MHFDLFTCITLFYRAGVLKKVAFYNLIPNYANLCRKEYKMQQLIFVQKQQD